MHEPRRSSESFTKLMFGNVHFRFRPRKVSFGSCLQTIFFVHKSIFFNINILFVTKNFHVQVAYHSVNNSPSAEHPDNRKHFILRQAVPMLKAWSFGIGSDSVNTVIEFLLS